MRQQARSHKSRAIACPCHCKRLIGDGKHHDDAIYRRALTAPVDKREAQENGEQSHAPNGIDRALGLRVHLGESMRATSERSMQTM
jgi:hypothetical protein